MRTNKQKPYHQNNFPRARSPHPLITSPERRERDGPGERVPGKGRRRGRAVWLAACKPEPAGGACGTRGRRLPAAKWSGVDFLPAVSRLFTFSGVTSLFTRSTSPLRQASNSSRADGSTASARALAQAAPPPAQRRPDMILAAAASSSASKGSRSPGPASRRARPPAGDALRARVARLPAVTRAAAGPWPRRRAPPPRLRDPRLPHRGGRSANPPAEPWSDAAAEAAETTPASSVGSWERA